MKWAWIGAAGIVAAAAVALLLLVRTPKGEQGAAGARELAQEVAPEVTTAPAPGPPERGQQAPEKEVSERAFAELKARADSFAEAGDLKGAFEALSDLPDSLTEEERGALAGLRRTIEEECSTRVDEALAESVKLEEQGAWEEAIRATEAARPYDLSGGSRVEERITEIRRALDEQARAAEAAREELRGLWKERVAPHLAERRYEAAASAFEQIVADDDVAPAGKTIAALRAQLDALLSVRQRIDEYAASLSRGDEIAIGALRGKFASYRDGTFTVQVAGKTVDRSLEELSGKDYVELARRALPKDDAATHYALALLYFYASPLELDNVASELDAAEKLTAGVPGLGAALHELREMTARAEAENEAEKLYQTAARAYSENYLFRCRAALKQLRDRYPDAALLEDEARSPTFAEMSQAVADLGQHITVAKTRQADFRTIQQALDAAPPRSLIEILDSASYNEALTIKRERITLRGARGNWPIIHSAGPERTNFTQLVQILAGETTLERLVLAHAEPAPGGWPQAAVYGRNVRLRSLIAYVPVTVTSSVVTTEYAQIENCLVIGSPYAALSEGSLVCRDSIFLGNLGTPSAARQTFHNVLVSGELGHAPYGKAPLNVSFSTLRGPLTLTGMGNIVRDSIVRLVKADRPGNRIENVCAMEEPGFLDAARPDPGCFVADPDFVDPDNLDYRLGPRSPCRGRASDGGDIGFRYTPEITEVLELAFELRRKGIIEF